MVKNTEWRESKLRHQVLQAKMSTRGPFSIESPGAEAVEGETKPRRHPLTADGLITKPSDDMTTAFEILRATVAKYGNAKAIGSRRLVRTHQETKKVKKMVEGVEQEVDKNWTFFELSAYEYLTYNEFEKQVLNLGSGLRKLGMSQGDRLHIFAATSANWLAMFHGAASQSIPVVTAYDTLGQEGLRHSMVATGAKAIFLDPHLLPTLGNVLNDAKEVRHVIWNSHNQVNQKHIDSLKSSFPHLTVLSFKELEQLGVENTVEPAPPTPEDLCCIMYTSGSTGTPKGVPLKHKALVAAGKSFSACVPDGENHTDVSHSGL